MASIGLWYGSTAQGSFIKRSDIASDFSFVTSRLCTSMSGTVYSAPDYWIDGFLSWDIFAQSNDSTGVEINERLIAPASASSPSGHIFAGWFALADGGDEYDLAAYSRFVTKNQTLQISDLESMSDVRVGATNNLTTYWVIAKHGAPRAVTFDVNAPFGLSATVAESARIVAGGFAVGALPIPTCPNCTFVGWYDSATGGYPVTAETIVYADTTFFARWVLTVGVMFDANGGELMEFFREVQYEQPYGDMPEPTRPGWTFVGWYTSATGGDLVTAETIVTNGYDHVLYAHWTMDPVTMTVHFIPCGGTVTPTSRTVTSGEIYGDLPIPIRDGYTFEGWHTASLGGDLITSSTVVGRSFTHWLYAQWTTIASDEPSDKEFGPPIGRFALKKETL